MKTPKKKLSSGQKTIEQQLRFTMRKLKKSITEYVEDTLKREKEDNDAEQEERRIRRRKKNPRNADGGEEERRGGERRKEERI